VKIFLDSSVLLSACHSDCGASRAVFSLASAQGWKLLTSPWVVCEATKNLAKFPPLATNQWLRLRQQLDLVDDVVCLDRVLVFPVSKDRPVLITALAYAELLLTLDHEDFIGVLGASCYGLAILPPYDFLTYERKAGRLSDR